jgi:hypothetical protein
VPAATSAVEMMRRASERLATISARTGCRRHRQPV